MPNYDQCTGELRGGFESSIFIIFIIIDIVIFIPGGHRIIQGVPSGSWGFPGIAGVIVSFPSLDRPQLR